MQDIVLTEIQRWSDLISMQQEKVSLLGQLIEDLKKKSWMRNSESSDRISGKSCPE
jgi:hypothetical protein